jgi:predicted transcriptional regulator
MKSNIDIICRYVRDTKSGSLQDIKNRMVVQGRNMKNVQSDINCLIDTGVIRIDGLNWTINQECTLWDTINKRLRTANDQDY